MDSTSFRAAKNIAVAHVTVKSGGMQSPFQPRCGAWTSNPGDVGYVPKTLGHSIENSGDTDLVFLELFKTSRYQDISLNDWITHIPPELVMQHLGISREILDAIPKANTALVAA